MMIIITVSVYITITIIIICKSERRVWQFRTISFPRTLVSTSYIEVQK